VSSNVFTMFGRVIRITLCDQLPWQQHVVILPMDTVLYIAFLWATQAWYFINNCLQWRWMTRGEKKDIMERY